MRKSKFFLSKILIAANFCAISIACVFLLAQQHPIFNVYEFFYKGHFIFLGPFCIPLMFVAYAVGRRDLTVRMLIAFLITEVIGIVLVVAGLHFKLGMAIH
jgi:hypothetical protein